jgi:actinin alpha
VPISVGIEILFGRFTIFMSARSAQGTRDAWIATQAKGFSRWCTKQLVPKGLSVQAVTTDFRDGVKLLWLIELVGNDPIDNTWHAVPSGADRRDQELANVGFAIEYITQKKGGRLFGITPELIVDGNEKATLGVIWSLIYSFVIDNISVEELTARDALLIWCKENTAGYSGVDIRNFMSSWVSGLAWCALLHKFRPQLLDYSAFDQNRADKNVHLANTSSTWEGSKSLGIAELLDPEDVVGPLDDPTFAPDEKVIVTQVSELYHFFAADPEFA